MTLTVNMFKSHNPITILLSAVLLSLNLSKRLLRKTMSFYGHICDNMDSSENLSPECRIYHYSSKICLLDLC